MKTVMYVRSLRHCDWDAVREYLRAAPWHVMDIFDDIDDKWNFFKSCLHYALNQHAPIKKVVSKCSKRLIPWLTDHLLMAIKEKQRAKCHTAKLIILMILVCTKSLKIS